MSDVKVQQRIETMDCFWPRCSNHKRCEAYGSCVAKAQAGGAAWPKAALAPVDLDEKTIQHLVDSAPEPLKKLGEYLADVLDADQWNHAEQYLLALAARKTA